MFKQEGDYEKLCLKLNYQFRDKELLARAITAKSAWHNNLQNAVIGHHEEMAFFGDGILRMVVDKILMDEFPYYKVGELSKTRDLLVNNINLGEAAKRLGLEQFIYMDANQAKQCQQGNPKLLADTVEAIIYAIYKDSNKELQEVEKFIFSNSNISKILTQKRETEEQRFQPIIWAIRGGNVKQAQEILEQGFPPNFKFRDIGFRYVDDLINPDVEEYEVFLTPLDYALDYLDEYPENMLCIIENLLKYGANPNLIKNTELIDKLFSLPYFVSENIVFLLSKYQKNKDEQALKKFLAYRNNLLKRRETTDWEKITNQIIEMFCRFGVKLDRKSNLEDYTLLELAIIYGQHYKIDLLLKHKTNPNIQNNWGMTSLHLAGLLGDNALTVKLLNAGANPTLADWKDLKPFDIAASVELKKILLKAEIEYGLKLFSPEINMEEIKQVALNHYKKWLAQKLFDELAIAIQLFAQLLKARLQNKNFHDINLIYDFYNLGSSYFQRGNYGKAKFLLERAYILYLINEQQFQVRTDKYYNRLAECEKLIEHHKQEGHITEDTDNIFKNTENPSQLKSFAILPENKQLNHNNLNQELFSAIGGTSATLVMSLLKKGANPDAVSEVKGPALHYAITQYVTQAVAKQVNTEPYSIVGMGFFLRGALEVIHALLNLGADPNQRDVQGRTALHIAAIMYEKFRIEDKNNLIGLLLTWGADPNFRDYDNNFASHYTKERDIRHSILSVLVPAQSTTEITPRLFNISVIEHKEKAPSIKKASIQANIPIKIEEQENKAKIVEVKESSSNDIDKKLQIKAVLNTSAKLFPDKNIKEERYKASLCRFFKEGKPNSCNRGDQCRFAHSTAELKR